MVIETKTSLIKLKMDGKGGRRERDAEVHRLAANKDNRDPTDSCNFPALTGAGTLSKMKFLFE